MILGEIIAFLSKTPPFNLLDAATLKEIAGRISVEFHPTGTTIVHQGGPARGYLNLLIRGEVRVFLKTGEGEEVLIDYLGEGDSFGLLSLVSGDIARDTVVATKDTHCYAIDKATVLNLIASRAAFTAHYLKCLIDKIVDMMHREIHDRSLLYGGGDKLLFTVTLDDLVTGKITTASKDSSIQEAAEKMAQEKSCALLLLDADGFPAGLITDKDLRNKVVAKGRDMAETVGNIMSVTLLKSEARDYCFEALLKMIRYNVHHLLVVNRGEVRGILTSHDLMMLQGTSPLTIAREIESQETIDGLVPVSKKINRLVTTLINEGARASTSARIITEINDRLLRKMLELTEQRLGPPPAPYCWIVFGSEGRKEQTFKTDQDNALMYDDSAAGEEEAQRYFADFSAAMNGALVKCGFPSCPAGYMASNSQWRQPLGTWKQYFAEWIGRPVPESILLSHIFFDFRAMYGTFTLAEKLRAYLAYVLKNQNIFLANMAGGIVRQKLPLSIFKTVVFEKSGRHKDEIDLKVNGLSHIIDIARLCALEKGVYNTSTIERLRALKGNHPIVTEFCSELEQAFEFFMTLRLRHQFAQLQGGEELNNFIKVQELSSLERKTLEEAFRVISKVQDMIKRKYHTME